MILETKECSLYYEVRGEGPALLLIHGVVVDAWLYARAAELLAPHYRVITYDRRGCSRSTARPDASFDLDAQVRDAKALLDALGVRRAFLCGASAGAIIGEAFFERYPEMVERLVMYEPPLVPLLEDGPAWVAEMKELIARRRYNTATIRFLQSIGEADPRAPEKPKEVVQREMENIIHFLEHEFSVFMDARQDAAFCAASRSRITVAVGDRSGDLPYARTARAFAARIGVEPVYFPGGHNSPQELPASFAASLMGVLSL